MASYNKFRWEPSKNIKFIDEYKQQRCLWDPKHALYKNRDAREAAYAQIQEALDMASTLEVIKRIRVLRNTLTNEINKARTPNRKGQMYKSRIKWLTHMDFIINMLNRENKRNETLYKPLQITDLVQSKSNLQNPTPTEASTENNEETTEPFRAVNAPEKAVTQNTTRANIPYVHVDEFHLFGQTVGEQLRQLPLETALETEEMILAIIRKRRVEVANRLTETKPLNDSEVKMEEYWGESPVEAEES